MRLATLRSVFGSVVTAALTLSSAPAPAQVSSPAAPDHEAALKNPDGSWRYTNKLAGSTSPYLLQHAHNPVDWEPWGPEALARAKKEDKPIFLSIGYSTCYWCHVMEREVFSDPAIAAQMNAAFVCIKVDREERPDLDEVYMTATQLMTQGGGWPNSLFLTTDLKPFFAGTYFGPTDGNGRPGFPSVVAQLDAAWKDKRAEVTAVGDRAAAAIKSVLAERLASIPKAELNPSLVDACLAQIAAGYDPREGGFGQAPKFPNDFYYSFLLDLHARKGADDGKALEMATRTLAKMAAGGIHDHVGGGFHRYSTDGLWRVPHFEKMLYNQGQLARAYLDAFAATGDPEFERAVRGTFAFVAERFTSPDGAFYSALDAETDAVEGAYYVWTHAEIEAALGKDDAAKFLAVFDLAPLPMIPGHKHADGGVPFRRDAAAVAAGAQGDAQTAAWLGKLADVRRARKLPRLDDKVIAGWNGIMIDAYARGYEVLHDEAYRAAAERAASFVLLRMRSPLPGITPGGGLVRVFRAESAGGEAFLEDYAFVIRGLLSLHRATGDKKWLDAAADLTARANALLWDGAEGGVGSGYFFAPAQADLIARSKDATDNAIPGGNAVMAHNLLDLWRATGDVKYRDKARVVLETFSGVMSQMPRGSVHLVHALERYLTLAGDPAAGGDPAKPSPAPSGVVAATDSSAHVRVKAAAEPATLAPGGSVTVTLTLDIDAGWHVQANPATLPDLIATSVDVRSDLPIDAARVAYPPGEALTTAAAKEPIRVYGGATSITATVTLPSSAKVAAGPATLRVLVRFQACDDKSCLAPAERIVEVSVTVTNRPLPR